MAAVTAVAGGQVFGGSVAMQDELYAPGAGTIISSVTSTTVLDADGVRGIRWRRRRGWKRRRRRDGPGGWHLRRIGRIRCRDQRGHLEHDDHRLLGQGRRRRLGRDRRQRG